MIEVKNQYHTVGPLEKKVRACRYHGDHALEQWVTQTSDLIQIKRRCDIPAYIHFSVRL